MNKKKLLVCALALSTVGVLSTIDTAGVLPFSVKTVQADTNQAALDVKAEILGDKHLVLKIKATSFLEEPEDIVPTLFSADTHEQVWGYRGPEFGEVSKDKGLEKDFYYVPSKHVSVNKFEKLPDGKYYFEFHHQYQRGQKFLGRSNLITVKDGKYVKDAAHSTTQPAESSKPIDSSKPVDNSKSVESSKPVDNAQVVESTRSVETSKTNQNSKSNPNGIQSGWSGSSYYQDGSKVISKWIFDKNYNSYFYLDASGNYVQNAWVGNYYLKSGGYMAKSEWIFDKNYGAYYYLTSEGSYSYSTWVDSYYVKSNGKMATKEWIFDKNYDSYYYLTSEGSYARNKWVGDYYLKSDGKMAVNERTPDGYQVDGSGKWIK